MFMMHADFFFFFFFTTLLISDQIDENLRTALQLDLLAMAPGLRVQVRI